MTNQGYEINPLLPDIVSNVCQKCGDFFKVHYTSKVFLCPKCSTDGKQVSDEDFGKTTKLYSLPAQPELLTREDNDKV